MRSLARKNYNRSNDRLLLQTTSGIPGASALRLTLATLSGYPLTMSFIYSVTTAIRRKWAYGELAALQSRNLKLTSPPRYLVSLSQYSESEDMSLMRL